MLQFHSVTLEDKEWINEIFKKQKRLPCEYCFGNIFSYAAKFPIYVARVESCFISKCIIDGQSIYCFPRGDGDTKKAIDFVIEDAKKEGHSCRFFAVGEADREFLMREYPDRFEITEDRDGMDYVYNSEDLINLRGKKYQPKRNHISFFEKNYHWTYERMNGKNVHECVEMSENWLYQSAHTDKTDLEDELKIIRRVADNFDALQYKGGLIRIDGEVIAYAMGEELTEDMFCVHFEKAYPGIRGAYPIINREFVKNELSSYRYINREDDVGSENLRKAKLSYYPEFLIEEYEAGLI